MKRFFSMCLACTAVLSLSAANVASETEDAVHLSPDTVLRVRTAPRVSLGLTTSILDSAEEKPQQTAHAVGGKIATSSLSVVATRNNRSYSLTIVGGNPFVSNTGTTSVPVVIIPVILKFQYSGGVTYIFDPTSPDTGCLGANTAVSLTQQSPLFNSASFTLNGVPVGATQYTDAILRGEFWQSVATNAPNYHLTLSATTAPVQTVTVTASNTAGASGTVYSLSNQCGTNSGYTNKAGSLGVVNINTFDPIAQSLISTLGIGPTQLPLFILYNTALSQGSSANLNNCCILGYHSAYGSVSSPQTYAVADFEGRNQTAFSGVSDVAVISHELNEWVNDPYGNNLTPAWGKVGQVTRCQSDFEVGDPLSGTLMPPVQMNGFSYHLQEIAFFSWFYSTNSIGAGAKFSSNGTFTTDAGPICR